MWVLVIASVLVSSLLLEGRAFAAGEKKIVMVSNSIDFVLLKGVLLNPLNGIKVVHTLSFVNALAVEIPLNKTVTDLVNLVSGITSAVVHDDLVVSVLPIIPAPSGVVSLTQDMYDWGLMHIDADIAHQTMPAWTGSGVQVAIVDTGVGDTVVVGCAHPDLPLIDVGFNALPGGGSYCDGHGHGTHIAGIIAARVNNRGLIGVAPGAGIVAVRVLNANGQGNLSDVINGLEWVYDNQPQIRLINMSLGFSTNSPPLEQAIQLLGDPPPYGRGILMVASAGNSCSDAPGQSESGGAEGLTCDAPQTPDIKYPAAYPEVLAVTATESNDQITSYSLDGHEVDVTAPGGSWAIQRILSTYKGGGYGYGIGTSQAAAHVSGALALKLQQQQQLQQPALSLSKVQQLLACTATKLQNPSYPATKQGEGLINVELLLAPPSPPCPPQ
jgi:subtilisin family serine protease